MGKRKGTDIVSPDPGDDQSSSSWEELKKKLEEKEKMIFSWFDKLEITDAECSLDKQHKELEESANTIKTSLEKQISESRNACDDEMNDLSRLKETIRSIEKESEELERATTDLHNEETKLNRQIQLHKGETVEQQEELNMQEIELMQKVPKIKNEISLYAKTTGIKWDYNCENLIAGQVAVPSLGLVSQFSIDPLDYNAHEIANYLWSAIEGKQYEDDEITI
eukprot:CAMPEP_0194184538 /NCGR_PEP_ID=MMETSP0154-20130528/38431_1 /TAXON_ID=1049557 /ORGANISM="Thalassiothrix antarctica, Strain L6-D1" /LENGTH=222 /DNA_ID=CAMNT_0038902261 /DNA_START=31 /DNA_END=699 /DNA_ORIENTATION=-